MGPRHTVGLGTGMSRGIQLTTFWVTRDVTAAIRPSRKEWAAGSTRPVVDLVQWDTRDGTGSAMTMIRANIRNRATALVGLVVVCLSLSCSVSGVPEVSPARACDHRLARIGRAIAKYRTENGPLPQSVVGPTGLEHSWRVLVAPYVRAELDGETDLAYRFDEPWDSLHNRQELLNRVPCQYTCPSESTDLGYQLTSYLMLVHNQSGSSRDGALVSLPGDAVLVVESARCGIAYAEPRDIDLDSLLGGDSAFGVGRLNSLHPSVVKALRVDGQVIEIPKDTPSEKLRVMLQGSVGAGRQ